MSDEAYSLVAIVSSLALMAVLWLRFRQARIFRRLMRSLTDEQLEAAGLDVREMRARFGPHTAKEPPVAGDEVERRALSPPGVDDSAG